jgi:hypothetical protein
MGFALPVGLTFPEIASELSSAGVLGDDVIMAAVNKEARDALRKADLSRLMICIKLGWYLASTDSINDLSSALCDERISVPQRLAMFNYYLETFPALTVDEMGYHIGRSDIVVELIQLMVSRNVPLDEDFRTHVLENTLTCINPKKQLEAIAKVEQLFALGVVPTARFTASTIRRYFDFYHRKWRGSLDERRAYIKFTNDLLERDDVMLGREWIDTLRQFAQLSIITRKAKTKIRALMLAAEMVGDGRGEP